MKKVYQCIIGAVLALVALSAYANGAPDNAGLALFMIAGLPFSNVVASGVATSSLPLGMSYNCIVLQLGGTAFTTAHITDIKVRLNGKVIWNDTAERNNLINVYRGMPTSTAFVEVDFTEPQLKRIEDHYAGNINTARGVSSLALEVTISGATAPTLTPYYELNGPAALGVIAKRILFTAAFSASGKFPFKIIDAANAGAMVKRVHFSHTGNMTILEVKKNGTVIFDNIPTAVNTRHQARYGKTAQANLFTYDPIVDDNGANMLVTADARNLEFNPTFSGADNVTAVAEVIDVLGNM